MNLGRFSREGVKGLGLEVDLDLDSDLDLAYGKGEDGRVDGRVDKGW